MTRPPLVSVVTPFHNTAAYLEQCIASVLGQTYTDFEYLLCDNCSSDGSTEIARRFAQRDRRVRLLRFEELLPQVANYNRALRQIDARARWCKIVQADDWLYARCLERMVEVAALDGEVGLVGAYYLEGTVLRAHGLPVEAQVFDGREVVRAQLRQQFFVMGSPTTVMYRADVVRGRQPFYAEDRYHEDSMAAYEILAEHKLGFVHEVLSYIRVGNPSITSSYATFNDPLLDGLLTMERYAQRFLPAEEARARRRAFRRRYWRFLGGSLLRLRGGEFWSYHRRGLATIGWRWSWARVALAAAGVALWLLLNPGSSAARAWRFARARVGKAT
jgi:glycosyltransferase involved in cell wall biosynthesis